MLFLEIMKFIKEIRISEDFKVWFLLLIIIIISYNDNCGSC